MAFNFDSWAAATNMRGSEQPGARALWKYCDDRWPFSGFGGIYVPRKVAGSSTPSHHAEGRAIDIMIAPLAGGVADVAKGRQLIEALGPHGRRLGIDTMIWNRQMWSRKTPGGRKYKGKHPHHDHIHIGLTRAAAGSLDLDTIASIVDGTPLAPIPALGGITHRVAATGLAFRTVPSAADRATVIARFQPGAELAQLPEAARDDGEHTWIRVSAVIGRAIKKGWVATDNGFLTAVTTGASSTSAPAQPQVTLEGITHRVEATNLALRTAPSTADRAAVITRLQPGDELAQLPDAPQNDGEHHWIKVRTVVRGTMTEGWVATDNGFLKAVG